MSSLLLRFKRNSKDGLTNRRSPLKSPLTQSTVATTPQKYSNEEHIDDSSSSSHTESANSSPMLKHDVHQDTPATSSHESSGPTITVHASTTPGPKWTNHRPPPLDIPSRKVSLTVNDMPSIPFSQSLDDLSSRASGSSLDSAGGGVSPLHRPSSPLLSALREAVDSLSNMGDFEIIEKIGKGFFAEVFKVQHVGTKQIMVMKINQSETSNQTKREVEVLKKLSHPNLLHYLGACIHNGKLHPLTEYINGGTLDSLILDKTHPFPSSLRVQLAHDIAKGMEYLHSNGMLHRDFNSHNCLLRKNGSRYTAVVADFGLCTKNPKKFNSLKRMQSIVGTPYWMAPEVLNGKPYDEKADVFSYGIVLCEIISRKPADPDDMERLKDYSLDETAFRNSSEVKLSLCPPSFIDLACDCTRFHQAERPGFTEINDTLVEILLTLESCDGNRVRSESLPPTPEKRLSWHYSIFPPSSHDSTINNNNNIYNKTNGPLAT